MLIDKRNTFYFDQDEGGAAGTGEGEQAAPQIDWSTIDPSTIPAEVVKKTSEYKGVLDESISRRKTIAALKDTLEDKPQVPENKNTVPSGEDAPPAWAAAIIQRLDSIEQMNSAKDVNALRQAIAKEAGWTPEQAAKLSSTDEAGIKAEIADFEKTFGLKDKRFGGVNANQNSDDAAKTRRSRILSKVGAGADQIAPSIFGKEFQEFD